MALPWEEAASAQSKDRSPASEVPPWELAKQEATPPWEQAKEKGFLEGALDWAGDKIKGVFEGGKVEPQPVEELYDPNVMTPGVQGEVDRMVAALPASPVGKVAFGALAAPAKAVAGASERLGAAERALQETQSLGQAADAFMNPAAIQKLRSKMPAWDQIKEQPFTEATVNGLERAYTELFPDLRVSDTLNPEVKDFILKYTGGEALLGKKYGRPALNFAIDVGTDPLNYVGIGQATKAAKASQLADKGLMEARSVQEMVDAYKATQLAQKAGLAADIERGDKALLNIAGMEIKGQKLAEKYEDLKTSFQAGAGSFLRPFQQRSGIPKWDTMAYGIHPIQAAADAEDLLRIRGELAGFGEISENASRYVRAAREHGDDAANAIMRTQGVKLTPEEYMQAQKLSAWQDQNLKPMLDELAAAGGADYTEVIQKLPTLEEQKIIREKATKKYGREIPAIVVEGDDGTKFDITFAGRGGKYSPRAMNEATKDAKKLQSSLNEWNAASRGRFGAKTSAELAREELSTEAMNVLLGEKFGTKEAFNANYPEVVMRKMGELKQRVNDLKLIDFTKKNYGFEKKALQTEVIDKAIARVEAARTNNLAPSIEDLRLSKMTVNDFRPLNDAVWNKWDYAGKAGKNPMLMQKDLYYPKAIADRVESQLIKPSQEGGAAFFSWVQNQWAKNRLADPFRLGPQAMENGFKMLQLMPKGFKPAALLDETRSLITGHRDRIGSLMDKIPVVNETPVNLKDFGGPDSITNEPGLLRYLLGPRNKPIMVTPEMLANPETQKATYQWLEGFHGALKDGKKVEDLMPTAGKVARTAKDVTRKTIEFMNDNPVSRSARAFANSADLVTKRAYMRSLLENGMNPVEAAMQVGNDLMDFGATTETLKKARYFSPFASFQAKNLETLFPLLAAKPGVANIVNPYEGHFKRMVEDASGWNPETVKALQSRFPLLQNKAFGSFLKGQEQLLNDGSTLDRMLADYVKWGIGEGAKDVIKGGTFLSYKIPSNFSGASEFLNPMKINETFGSPLMAAIFVGASGVDPYTGEKLPAEGTKMQAVDRWSAALRKMNPIEYRRTLNAGFAALPQEMGQRLRAKLEEGPISREMAKGLGITLGSDAPLGKLKISKEAVNTLIHPKFMGLAKMDDVDWTYFNHQMALVRSLGKVRQLLTTKAKREGRGEALRALDSYIETAKDINKNAKAYMDYRAMAAAAGSQMDALTQDDRNLLERSISMPQSVEEELMLEGQQAIDEALPLPNQ